MSVLSLRRLRGESPPPAEPAPVAPSIETIDQIQSPHEFIDAFEDVLTESATAWREVAHSVTSLQSPDFINSLKEGIAEVSDGWRIPMSVQTIENEARRISSTLAIHSLLAARYLSLTPPRDQNSLTEETYRKIFGTTDDDVGYLAERVGAQTSGAISEASRNMTHRMRQADACAQVVLTGLTIYNDRQPDSLTAFADLYRAGAADTNQQFRELREIVSTDWHHYDPASSYLQRYCTEKSIDPSRYKAEFASYVAEATHDKKTELLRTMAHFAISTAQQHGVELSVEEVLASTFDNREDFTEFNIAFRAFLGSKEAQLEQAYETIAGLKNNKSIRLARPIKEIEDFKNNMYVNIGSREERRRRKVSRRRKAMSAPVPDDNEIQKAAAETERAPRKLMIAKNNNGVSQLEEITMDDVIETFSINAGNGCLKEDVGAMVDYLRREPISPASKRLQSMKITIQTTSGKQTTLPMRRFAPEQAGGKLQVHGDNRYYRIIYALVDDGLVITNILSHEAYNKTY